MKGAEILSRMHNGERLMFDRDPLSGEMVFSLRTEAGTVDIEDQSVASALTVSGAVVCVDLCACGHTEYMLPPG